MEDSTLWYELGCDVSSAGTPSSTCFDAEHDAIVTGWSHGMITTSDIYALGLPYTSFKAHPGAVTQLQGLGGGGILSLSDTHLCLHSIGGAPVFSSQVFDKVSNSIYDFFCC